MSEHIDTELILAAWGNRAEQRLDLAGRLAAGTPGLSSRAANS
jgi:hypothetical protein